VLTPVFYVLIQRFVEGRELKKSQASEGGTSGAPVEA
jgi:hypothetical protein